MNNQKSSKMSALWYRIGFVVFGIINIVLACIKSNYGFAFMFIGLNAILVGVCSVIHVFIVKRKTLDK